MSVKMSIGVCGRARHGKDTSALLMKRIFEDRKIPCQVISFADPLKDFLTAMVGRAEPFRGTNEQRSAPIPELLWADLAPRFLRGALKSWGPGWCRPIVYLLPERFLVGLVGEHLGYHPNGRQMMQLFGTETIRENLCESTWLKIADNRARGFNGVTIVADVRFPNEARPKWAGGMFDLVIKVVRAGQPVINHPSEWSVDLVPPGYFRAVIENNGTEDDLFLKLLEIIDDEFKIYNHNH
jgi:hypothetical protein